MAGAFGSFFVSVNTWMGYLRKRIITSNARRIIETGFFGFATISVMTFVVISYNECIDIPPCNVINADKGECND